MKILVISALYAPHEIGGAEITARAISEGLAKNGHEVTALSLAPDGRFASREINGVKCIYVPLSNLFWLHGPKQKPAWQRMLWHLIDAYNPIMERKVGAVLDAEKPDIVHIHNLQGFSVAVWRAAKKDGCQSFRPSMTTISVAPTRPCIGTAKNCSTPCVACRFLTLPRLLSSSSPDTVIGVSKRVLARLEDRGLFKKVRSKRVIYGCNLDEPTWVSRPDKLPSQNIVLGFFGRIEPIKGLEVLLETLKKLNDLSFTLLIGGRGNTDYVEQLKNTYENSKIRFLGFIKPADFFAQIDMLVVPSLWEEPLGRVIHESFSYGVPVIASRLGGMPELILSAGTGFLFKAGDSDELAKILSNFQETGFAASRFFSACLQKSEEFRLDKILADYTIALTDAAKHSRGKVQ